MIRCSDCKENKPESDFTKKSKSLNGLCSSCRLKKDREQRAKAIGILGGSCIKCGEKDSRYLEIDTLAGKTTGNVYKRILNGEAQDYIVLCGNCSNLKEWHREIYEGMVSFQNRSKFDIDRSYGKEREHRFAEMINSTMEVKSDRKANVTGNVYVEFESRGKPGGVSSTAADVWVQEVDEDVFVVMPVKRMRELVQKRLEKYGPVLGGDGKTSKGVLLRVTELTKPMKEA